VASSEAKKITVRKDENERGQTVTIEYKEIGELPVDGIVYDPVSGERGAHLLESGI